MNERDEIKLLSIDFNIKTVNAEDSNIFNPHVISHKLTKSFNKYHSNNIIEETILNPSYAISNNEIYLPLS